MENNHIVCMIHPFVMEQEISVYRNGECIKTAKCTLDNVEETILNLVSEQKIRKIDLAGNQLYSLKVKENLENAKTVSTDFTKNLEITIY